MRVDKLTLERIFERTERLEAPLFQRPYVWRRERNWQPLWDAIVRVADIRFAGTEPRPCFLGAVVLDQLKTATGRLHARQIIDGQQRLTTLQLAIAAARDFCAAKGEPNYAEVFKKLNCNHVPLSKDPDDVFKVWPTNADRADFRDTLNAGSIQAVRTHPHADEDDSWLIPNAYLFFAEAIAGWVGECAGEDLTRRLEALYFAIKEDLHVVVIDLEEKDDAQVIFETLNALGTPLLPADLVKNYLFHLAEFQKQDTESLYEMYWAVFDTNKHFWREEVRQGRLKRSRLDRFMSDYLTMQTGQEVVASSLFSAFREFVKGSNGQLAATHMELFRSYADVFQGFSAFHPDSREGQFFYRLDQLDTTTVYPLLLEVFKRYRDAAGKADRCQVIGDLESFFVRRAVCELTTKNYNRLFIDMIKSLRAKDDFSSTAIREYLQGQTAETTLWPSDEEFGAAWMTINFYHRLKRSKARMILEAIELSLFTTKTEKVQIERNLTIEHLLPKEWKRHWPLPPATQAEEEIEKASKFRDEMLHKVGNLTLLTKRLNPSVSNGPWSKKREKVLEHSALNMNRAFHATHSWDEAMIMKRSAELKDIAMKLWPIPAKPVSALT